EEEAKSRSGIQETIRFQCLVFIVRFTHHKWVHGFLIKNGIDVLTPLIMKLQNVDAAVKLQIS
ncbi:MAG: hypothetical protein Q8O74_03755, partial [bacterium]|nr:hypothetical protein [bacterium]